jgi:uncharacterized protein YyaL (SSP411 family)
MAKQPTASPKALSALSYYLEGRQQLSVVQGGNAQHPLQRANHLTFHPYTIRLNLKELSSDLRKLVPALSQRPDQKDQCVAYLCSSNGCTPVIEDSNILTSLLKRL